MKQMTWNKSRGMTLTELLAVLLIISLLTAIAVPVYVARQEDARVRVAIADCREIANAEDLVATMHGFYVPFPLLDELPPNPNNNNSDEVRIDVEPGLLDWYVINATIRAVDQFPPNQLRLIDGYPGASPINTRVANMINNWGGPFITWHRFWYDTSNNPPYNGPTDPQYKNSTDMFRDYPLDPWGNPYRFYSPIGIIGTGNDELTFDPVTPNVDFGNGRLTTNDDDRFQRYAVVSYGRDGESDTQIPNANNVPDNDIYYEFGTDGLTSNFGQF